EQVAAAGGQDRAHRLLRGGRGTQRAFVEVEQHRSGTGGGRRRRGRLQRGRERPGGQARGGQAAAAEEGSTGQWAHRRKVQWRSPHASAAAGAAASVCRRSPRGG